MIWTAKEETKEWKMLKDRQTWTRNRALIPDDVNLVKNNETQQQKGTKIVLWTDSNGRPRPVVYDKQEPRYKEDATNGDGVSVW